MCISGHQLSKRTLFAAAVLSVLSAASFAAPVRQVESAQLTVPTFSETIAPIIQKNCIACHRPHGAGPFSLLTYSEVKTHASEIRTVTRSRYMPPWLPESGYGHFEDERRLSEHDIETIAQWVAAGCPEGDPLKLLTATDGKTESGGWQLGTPDLILPAHSAFQLPPTGPDLFWNFVFEPQLNSAKFVRAVEIHPGNPKTVHHANLLIDRTGSVRKQQANSHAGFAGMDLNLNRNPFDPESHFLFWKPGSEIKPEPNGLSWRLDPGNLLVLNMHLQASGRSETIVPEIGLYFTSQRPLRFPVLVELQDDDALRIPAGSKDFIVKDELRLPVDVDVLAIYPHAHYLGKQLLAYANLPDGSRRELIRIPDWNFEWQSVYRYAEAVFLPAGSVVRMEFHYDNSAENGRNPHVPPRPVTAGNNADDEMGHLWLQLLPRGRGDQRRAIQQAEAEHRLERNPTDVTALVNLGALQLSRLKTTDAIATLSRAVKLDGQRPEAHDMLGMALQNVGRSQEAVLEFLAALQADHQYLNARFNLARWYGKRGDFDQAAATFKAIAKAFPAIPSVQEQYAEFLHAAKSQETARTETQEKN